MLGVFYITNFDAPASYLFGKFQYATLLGVLLSQTAQIFCLLKALNIYIDVIIRDACYHDPLLYQIRILNYTKYEMLNKALEAFGDLGDDEELGPADWPTVQNYITCLNNLDEEQVHPHLVSESDHHLQATNLRDIRVRLLNGKLSQQAFYIYSSRYV